MKERFLANCMMLLVCFVSSLSFALGQGKAAALGSSQAKKMLRSEPMPRQSGDQTFLTSKDGLSQDRHNLSLGAVGQAFHNASSRASKLFRRPAGWDQGNKTGWAGGNVPPGQAKKDNPRFSFLRRGPLAQRGSGPFETNANLTPRQVANFDRFLDLNPGLQHSLSQNPSLIRDQAFLADHPSLDAWLKAHPQAARRIMENPQGVKSLESSFEMHDINPGEVVSFDRYLDTHPNVAASLSKNPSLINNSTFLASNPSLVTWMKAHPQAALEMKENPQMFKNLEQRFEAAESQLPQVPSDL